MDTKSIFGAQQRLQSNAVGKNHKRLASRPLQGQPASRGVPLCSLTIAINTITIILLANIEYREDLDSIRPQTHMLVVIRGSHSCCTTDKEPPDWVAYCAR